MLNRGDVSHLVLTVGLNKGPPMEPFTVPVVLRGRSVHMKLSSSSLEFGGKAVDLADVIGARAVESGARAWLEIFCYPKKRGCGASGREASHMTVEVTGEGAIETSIRCASAIKSATAKGQPDRKFLVLVNPVSGSGRAVSLARNVVLPMLEQAGAEYRLVVTDRCPCL